MALDDLVNRDDLPEDVREEIKREIEARSRSEEAARAREQLHRGLFETLVFGVVCQSADGQITSANPAAERILGLSLDQMSGRTSMDPRWKAIHEDGSPFPGEEHPSMVALRTGREVRDVVMGVFHPQRDEHRWISITAIPLLQEGKSRPDQVLTTFEDITERLRAERALEEGERRYKLAAGAGRVGVWDLDVESGEFYLDPRLKALLGYTDRELANDLELWFHSVHPDDREAVKAAFSAFVEGRSPEFESEHRMLRRNRSVCWFLARGVALRGAKGRATRVLGTNVDITARRRAEEELRENEARQRGLVETIPDGLAAVDADGVCTFVNQQLCGILGYPREELLGRRLTDFLDPDGQKTWAAQRRRRQQKQGGQYVLRAVRRDGSRRRLRVSEKAMSDSHGFWSGSLVVMRDITEDLRTEETLRQRTRALDERVKELACLYGISRLEHRERASLDELLQGAVDLVPGSWQYPEIAGARLELEGREYRTDGFRKTPWTQTAPVSVDGETVGSLQVSYQEERSEEAEGPFLKEERDLIDSVADHLGHLVERQRSTQRLRESEERWASLVRGFKGIVFQGDTHFRPIFFEGAVREITGYEPEAFLGGDLRWDQLVHPDDLPEVLATAEKVRSLPDYSTDREYRIIREDGATRWVFETLQNVSDESGKPFRVQGMLRDSTGRKRAEEELLERSRRYERLLKSIADGVWVLDGDWRYTVANQRAAAFVGLSDGEIVGRKLTELAPGIEASPLFEMFRSVMASGNPSSLEHEQELEGGHTELHEVRAYPVPEGILCLGTAVERRQRTPPPEGDVEPAPALEKESPDPPDEAKGVILLIDGEEIVRETTSEMLEEQGMRALTADSDAAGLELYRERAEEIDLVILDVSRAGPGGQETLRRLRRIDPEARVILSSGFGRHEATRGFEELGQAGFIQKPYRPEALLAEIDRLLRGC